MKRYLLGIVALCLAVGFTAFKEISKEAQTNVDLYFEGNPLSQASVNTQSNWKEVSGTPPTCSGSLKACKITVKSTHVSGGALRNDATITSSGDTSDGFVPDDVEVSSTSILEGSPQNRN